MGKLTFTFDHYYDYEEVTQFLHDAVEAYPQLMRLKSIGKSHRGRDIWITELSAGDRSPDDKPGYYIDANTHPEELTGSMTALFTIKHLVENYGTDPQVTHLLDTRTLYILPRLNPDGAEFVLTLPFYEWIGNGRYLPGEEQFGHGLRYHDIDGNGIIVDMRIQDPKGEWKQSDKDPRLMVLREPYEYGGTYYRMIPEGLIEGFEGNADVPIPQPMDGNMNRNFPYGWGPEFEQYGGGNYPLEEPEIAAMVNFILDHPNIFGAINYHTHSGIILMPMERINHRDKQLFQEIASMGVKTMGYPMLKNAEDFRTPGTKERMGTSKDFLYDQMGGIPYTVELWDVFTESGMEKDWVFPLREFPEEDNLKLLKWNDDMLGGEGFMEWTPFEHPQLGEVEIGGWRRLYMFRNPPAGPVLEDLCKRATQFSLQHAAASPEVIIESFNVREIGDQVYEVKVMAGNTGYVGTYVTERALETGIAKPVTAVLETGQGVQLETGTAEVELGHFAGRFDRNGAYSRFKVWRPATGMARWVLRKTSADPVTIRVRVTSEKGGTRTVDAVL